jgi:hypothetical protein
VLRVRREHFRDADEPETAPLAQRGERGIKLRGGVAVVIRVNTVQVQDVHVVGPQALQATLHARGDLVRGREPVLDPRRHLGGQEDALAPGPGQRRADGRLGAVGFGGVDEVDTEGQCFPDHRRGVLLPLARAQPEAAVPAAPEPHHADPQPGAPQNRRVHHSSLTFPRPISRG